MPPPPTSARGTRPPSDRAVPADASTAALSSTPPKAAPVQRRPARAAGFQCQQCLLDDLGEGRVNVEDAGGGLLRGVAQARSHPRRPGATWPGKPRLAEEHVDAVDPPVRYGRLMQRVDPAEHPAADRGRGRSGPRRPRPEPAPVRTPAATSGV